ncbi:hypothetical protein Mal52_11230 [Symmachiella dynata]|uniref:Uncharacterized protein n=1 Tax=Symmachiella dynata TaxID=2527995 RepID=A0A517ZJJ0_9PLAN|nr:hypothetical protein [Symmachiella dynata]QDU42656.1 hypothetical protein Mal52_11230 [Symmachiella dynata]
MRLRLLAILPLITGCIGDADVPIVCSTDLPGTEYSIWLHGPHEIGYFYTIGSPDGDCGLRKLGQISIEEPVNPKLEDLGNGVFRITWENPGGKAFTTIDTEKQLIVNDSNKSNQQNTPFETPRYLRPEYADIIESIDRDK